MELKLREAQWWMQQWHIAGYQALNPADWNSPKFPDTEIRCDLSRRVAREHLAAATV